MSKNKIHDNNQSIDKGIYFTMCLMPCDNIYMYIYVEVCSIHMKIFLFSPCTRLLIPYAITNYHYWMSVFLYQWITVKINNKKSHPLYVWSY